MSFWIFMTISDLLIPIMMIILGNSFKKHAPREINGFFGYRTSMSMKNKDTWEFAHHYCGSIWLKLGYIMLIISIIIMFFLMGNSASTIGIFGAIICSIQVICLIASIFPTEKALKRTFNKDGTRKK